jgi:hypothetical protein
MVSREEAKQVTVEPREVPYDELDPPVVELVRVLNEQFDGLATIGSCGGHEDGKPGEVHTSADQWWVTFELEPADADADTTAPSAGAWMDLEFLAYWLGRDVRRERERLHLTRLRQVLLHFGC